MLNRRLSLHQCRQGRVIILPIMSSPSSHATRLTQNVGLYLFVDFRLAVLGKLGWDGTANLVRDLHPESACKSGAKLLE